MKEWFAELVREHGILAITGLMILENVIPPIPSEVVMPLAGYTAAQGDASFISVVLAGTLGSVLGTLPLYYLGRRFNYETLVGWLGRRGRYLGFGKSELTQVRDWFDRHGGKAVFLCRLVPGLRSLISIPAGAAAMPLPRFLLLTTAGSFLWCLLLATLGRSLGESHDTVSRYTGYASWLVLGALFIVGTRMWRKRRLGQYVP